MSTERNGTLEAPFLLKQGRTFLLVVTVQRDGALVDLSSPARTGRGQMRASAADTGTPVASFDVSIRDPQTGTDKGKADVSLGATVSAATAVPAVPVGVYQVDVEFENDTDPDDVIASDVFYVEVVAEVTK